MLNTSGAFSLLFFLDIKSYLKMTMRAFEICMCTFCSTHNKSFLRILPAYLKRVIILSVNQPDLIAVNFYV